MIAALTLAGVVFNGLVGLYIFTHVRTPSKRRLGELVEETHSITAGKVIEQLDRIETNGHAADDKRENAA